MSRDFAGCLNTVLKVQVGGTECSSQEKLIV